MGPLVTGMRSGGELERRSFAAGAGERQEIAGLERAAVETADRRARMGRAAAEHRRDGEAAGDRQIGAGTGLGGAKLDAVAADEIVRAMGRGRRVVDEQRKVAAGDGNPAALRFDHEGGADERHLDCGGAERIAGEPVGETERDIVHGARGGDAEALEAEAAEILDAGEEAGLDDAKMISHRRLPGARHPRRRRRRPDIAS